MDQQRWGDTSEAERFESLKIRSRRVSKWGWRWQGHFKLTPRARNQKPQRASYLQQEATVYSHRDIYHQQVCSMSCEVRWRFS